MKRCMPHCLFVLLVILILAAGSTGTSPDSSPSPIGQSTSGTGTSGISVYFNAMDTIRSSSYLELPNPDMNYIDVTITNPTGSPQTVIMGSEVPGYT
ncbi:MAG: hypothetical protein NTV68_05390 [Methanomicrobiales archaeon]|nr:hypothetical protein [Methanomicrobiales archaeon]